MIATHNINPMHSNYLILKDKQYINPVVICKKPTIFVV